MPVMRSALSWDSALDGREKSVTVLTATRGNGRPRYVSPWLPPGSGLAPRHCATFYGATTVESMGPTGFVILDTDRGGHTVRRFLLTRQVGGRGGWRLASSGRPIPGRRSNVVIL